MRQIENKVSWFFRLGSLALCLAAWNCRSGNGKADIRSTGTIEADEVRVAFKTGGQITKLFFEEGSRVKEGDLIATLDSSNLEIQLRQAEAGAAVADAQLRLLLNGSRSEDVRQVEEALKQAETAFSAASEDLKRIRNLLEKGSGTVKQRDDAQTRHTVAEAQYKAAQEMLKKVKNPIRPEEIQMARARLDQARAAADLLKKFISDCGLIAPISGIVTHRAMLPGEFVAPGASIVTIARLEVVHLMIYVTEAELGRIRLGDQADVFVDSHPGRAFPGKVVYLSPEAEFTPKNIQTKEERVKLVFGVKIDIDNRDLILKPGLPADAVIKEKTLTS